MKEQVVHASGAETTAGNSSPFRSRGQWATFAIHVSAWSGTTLTFEIEYSIDGSNWFSAETAQTFTAVTATGWRDKQVTLVAPHWRLKWSGTFTSITFLCHVLTDDN